jgi:hypothetical protein
MIGWVNKNLSESFIKGLGEMKKQLHDPKISSEKGSIVSSLWDLFITGMVLFFLKSIIDAYIK